MKRKLSFLLVLVMIISTFAALYVNPVNAATVAFEDVTADTKYGSSILSISKIGLINGYNEEGKTTFKPENQITRAEFTAIITRAMGMGDINGGESIFTDVPNDHWAKGNIQVAYDRKIVNGMGDGTFQPDSNVTYEQAVKMIVCTLGYDAAAQAAGGWPLGYMTMGGKLGVTKGVTGVDGSAPASRAVVAHLIYNTLEVDVLDSTPGFEKTESKTFMETYLKMTKDKAIIVGVGTQVTAQCPSTLAVNQMAAIINNKIVYLDYSQYSENEEDVAKYLGRTVTLYYKTEALASESILVDIGEETTKNTVTEISSEDIVGYRNGTITYLDEKEKQYTIDIDEDTSILYNNALVTGDVDAKLKKWFDQDGDGAHYDADDHKIYGTVRITDSGDTGVASLVEIMDYYIIVAAKAPSATDYRITNSTKYKLSGDVNDKNIILDPDGKIDYTVNVNGEEKDVLSIKANDVVMLAQSENGKKVAVEVAREVVSGKITKSYGDTITVNNKEYEFHERFDAYMDEKNVEMTVGSTVKLYLDIFGKVVYATVSATQTESPYAYIISSGEESTDKYFVKMFIPKSATTKTYTLKDRVTFNGESYSAEEVVELLQAESASTVTIGDQEVRKHYMDADLAGCDGVDVSNSAQIARVSFVGEEITTITTAKRDIDAYTTDSSALSKYMDCQAIPYKGSNNFNNKFYVNGSTTVIFVSPDRADTKGYKKQGASIFKANKTYYVEPYNVNESKIANLVLVYNATSSITEVSEDTKVSVVAGDMSSEYNKDEGKLYSTLPYYSSSPKLEEKIIGEDSFENLVPGDIFRAGSTDEGYLAGLEVVVTLDDILENLSDGDDIVENDEDAEAYSWEDNKYYKIFDGNTSYGHFRYMLSMYNLIQIDTDNSVIRVTTSGFVKDENGQYVIPSDAEEKRLGITDSFTILRYDSKNDEITPYIEGTQTAIGIEDLTDALTSGTDCNKIAIYSYFGAVRGIIIYD